MIILSRQARDKHRESTQKRVAFSCRLAMLLEKMAVRGNMIQFCFLNTSLVVTSSQLAFIKLKLGDFSKTSSQAQDTAHREQKYRPKRGWLALHTGLCRNCEARAQARQADPLRYPARAELAAVVSRAVGDGRGEPRGRRLGEWSGRDGWRLAGAQHGPDRPRGTCSFFRKLQAQFDHNVLNSTDNIVQ